jgi:hypothetical protein
MMAKDGYSKFLWTLVIYSNKEKNIIFIFTYILKPKLLNI